MRIGIIDADLIGRKKHRFPNLASMKISAYHKNAGDAVFLLLNYDTVGEYDKVYISKAFTDTIVPEAVVSAENVTCGGTGFASYLNGGWPKGSSWRYMEEFEQGNNEIAAAYFDMAA